MSQNEHVDLFGGKPTPFEMSLPCKNVEFELDTADITDGLDEEFPADDADMDEPTLDGVDDPWKSVGADDNDRFEKFEEIYSFVANIVAFGDSQSDPY